LLPGLLRDFHCGLLGQASLASLYNFLRHIDRCVEQIKSLGNREIRSPQKVRYPGSLEGRIKPWVVRV
jgi:hypothetical protein